MAEPHWEELVSVYEHVTVFVKTVIRSVGPVEKDRILGYVEDEILVGQESVNRFCLLVEKFGIAF